LFSDRFRAALDTKDRVEQCRLIQSIPVHQWVYEHGFASARVEGLLISVHPLNPLPFGARASDWVIVGVTWQDGAAQHVGVFASHELMVPGMSGSGNAPV
jgi:hypothetical protein